MIEALKITQILFSILLVLIILIQPKKSSLSITSFSWNEWINTFEKRGPEKILHNTTIFLAILFILNSLIFFFLA
jgi:protein translocase SecG subunit